MTPIIVRMSRIAGISESVAKNIIIKKKPLDLEIILKFELKIKFFIRFLLKNCATIVFTLFYTGFAKGVILVHLLGHPVYQLRREIFFFSLWTQLGRLHVALYYVPSIHLYLWDKKISRTPILQILEKPVILLLFLIVPNSNLSEGRPLAAYLIWLQKNSWIGKTWQWLLKYNYKWNVSPLR